jgi:uncharacterized protein YbbC (DUF1343 family)
LHEKVSLVAIFAPEHGIRSTVNEYFVNDELDEKTGLPIYSLHGKTTKPSPEMLKNVDVLVYDIQDVGARFYTYISTMKKCMEACSENNVTFVVLDRPNPLSGKVQGNILEEKFISFVGISKIPARYGLTPGEIAKYFNIEDEINCNLSVIKMSNYKKDMYYDETGLKFWINPSPAIKSLDTAVAYVGTCIFEWAATNVSDGRGSDKPFEYIGAPWINSESFAQKLNALDLPGVNFRPVSFTPCKAKFKDELCHGVFIEVLDRKTFDPVKTAITMIYKIRELYPEKLKLGYEWLSKLTGGDFLQEGKYTLKEILEKLDNDSLEFEKRVQKYRLYE